MHELELIVERWLEMRRDQKSTAVERLIDSITSYPHSTGRAFSHRFMSNTEHKKIKEWIFFAASLLTFLGMYYLFFNLIIWARFFH